MRGEDNSSFSSASIILKVVSNFYSRFGLTKKFFGTLFLFGEFTAVDTLDTSVDFFKFQLINNSEGFKIVFR